MRVSNTSTSKVEVLTEQLRRMAHASGPDGRLPTVREICEDLGVGMATLDNALKVLESQNVIYRKHAVGIFVSPKIYHRTIAVMLDAAFFLAPGASPFWGLLWGSFAKEAQRRAESGDAAFLFNLVIVEPAPDAPLPELLVNTIEAGQVHGVIGIGLGEKEHDWLRVRDVPFVNYAGPGDWRVSADMGAAIREGVDALAEKGCRRIGMWRSVPVNRQERAERLISPEEIMAFGNALAAHDLPMLPELVRQSLHLLVSTGGDMSQTQVSLQEQGYQTALSCFTDPHLSRPDGVLILDDMMTSGALPALNHLGLRVGKDVHIATQSNKGSHVLFGYERDMTLLEFDPEEIVTTLFRHLDALMEGRMPDRASTLLPPRRRDVRSE